DGQQFGHGGLAPLVLQALVAFAQSLCHGACHGHAGGLGDRPGEAVGFRVLDVEAGAGSFFPQNFLSLFTMARCGVPCKSFPAAQLSLLNALLMLVCTTPWVV